MEPAAFSGQRLAAARRAAHLTQRTLAAELGVTVRTLQNYEAGRFVPFRHLNQLEQLLGDGTPTPADPRPESPIRLLLARSRRERAQLAESRQRLRALLDELGKLVGEQQASAAVTAPGAPESGLGGRASMPRYGSTNSAG